MCSTELSAYGIELLHEGITFQLSPTDIKFSYYPASYLLCDHPCPLIAAMGISCTFEAGHCIEVLKIRQKAISRSSRADDENARELH